MPVLIVIFGIVLAIMLFLFISQSLEISSIKKQLEIISNQDSNELVHSKSGSRSTRKLICRINILLKDMRRSGIYYSKKSHDLEQMLTNISHDLRTPLTSAMGYIDIIINSDLSLQEKKKAMLIVERRLRRLEELINSFFEFSKIISSGQKPEVSEFNLVEILQEAIVHYYDDYSIQGRQVYFHCDSSRISISSNQNMLMRIFDNLISNSLKHGTKDLKVTVKADKVIIISFENELTEPDIDIDCIFDEFYTTNISRTKGNTGLGLAIAKQFTQLLNGEIRAALNENSFSVELEFSPDNES